MHYFMRYFLIVGLLTMSFYALLLHAANMEPRELVSPIVGKTFKVNLVPFDMNNTESLANMPANMGVDSDGCRHHAGISEYDHYIVTCPYSFFSAVSVEWNQRNGRFTQVLSNDFKNWVRGREGLHSDWFIARNRKYKLAQHIARLRGQSIGGIESFVIPQEQIGVDKKYQFALFCYAKRGARDAFMAKVALTAAWAMRVHLNRQLSDKDLAGGIKEINDRINRRIEEDEEFNLVKWHKVYKNIFNSARLSNEGYFIAGSTYLGLELRMGDHAVCDQILDKMTKRFADLKHGEKLRGIVRERRRILNEYRKFLSSAAFSFAKAISREEIRRSELPTVMLAVAEGLRRTGAVDQSIDWYLAIANLDETEPDLRARIRKEGRAPSPHASFYVHIGWKADLMIEQLTKGTMRQRIIEGKDSFLLNAIVNEGLGKPEHKNPHWKPEVGASLKDLEFMMNELGKSVVEYDFRLGRWPQTLGELWSVGVIPDWNRFNRFHCPVSGMPFLYTAPQLNAERLAQKKGVVVRTSQPVATRQGPRYLNYLANNTLVWTKVPVAIGDPVP